MSSLGNDLAQIREKRGLSIDDVKKSTRIPTHIIASIEDDSILEQLENNTTYTRSYIRSYAKAIGIKEERIVAALDKVEQGTYDGGIIQNEPDITANSKAKSKKKDEDNEDSKPSEPKKEPPQTSRPSRSTSSSPVKPAPGPSPENLDWVSVGLRAKTSSSSSPIRTGLLILLVAIALLAGGFIIYSLYYAETEDQTNQPSSEDIEQPTTPSDSLRQALISQRGANQPAATTGQYTGGQGLPDTLSLTIVAANGKLEPLRVYTDIMDQRNPYWVQQGDSIRFNFVNDLHVRAVNQYDRLQLLFNGHEIQNFYEQYFNEESGQVEISRAVIEDHPEWH